MCQWIYNEKGMIYHGNRRNVMLYLELYYFNYLMPDPYQGLMTSPPGGLYLCAGGWTNATLVVNDWSHFPRTPSTRQPTGSHQWNATTFNLTLIQRKEKCDSKNQIKFIWISIIISNCKFWISQIKNTKWTWKFSCTLLDFLYIDYRLVFL